MENNSRRFAIVVYPLGFDVADLVKTLTTSGVIPIHVMPYDQWADTKSSNKYDLFFVRSDGSWRFLSGRDDQSGITTEIKEYYRLSKVEA
jgi:hypothetical protein